MTPTDEQLAEIEAQLAETWQSVENRRLVGVLLAALRDARAENERCQAGREIEQGMLRAAVARFLRIADALGVDGGLDDPESIEARIVHVTARLAAETERADAARRELADLRARVEALPGHVRQMFVPALSSLPMTDYERGAAEALASVDHRLRALTDGTRMDPLADLRARIGESE